MGIHGSIVSRRGLRTVLWAAGLVACAAGWASAQKPVAPAAPKNQQVTGFRVPSYDSDNNLTSQLFGDAATILPDGRVDITELRLEFYSGSASNRLTEMRVTSPRCMYNRNSGSATSDAPVRLARENMVITGTGFEWNNRKQRLVIMQDAKVVLKEAEQSIGEGLKP